MKKRGHSRNLHKKAAKKQKSLGVRLFYAIAAVVVIALLFLYFGRQPAKNEVVITNSEGKNIMLNIDAAATREQREAGLSGRESIPEYYGLLYPFKGSGDRPIFWAKGMKFSLDWIFIDGNKILSIIHNIEPCQENAQCNVYGEQKGGEVDYVVEVNGGFAKKHNIEDGNAVKIGYG